MKGFIEYLETNYDVVEVSGGTQVKINGQCPFCGEDRFDMRMYCNKETGLGKCFHCDTQFGPYKFIMAAEGCSLEKAKAIAAGTEDGWEVTPKAAPATPGLIWPARQQIGDHPAAAQYLDDRGIKLELQRHFGMYYCTRPTVIGEKAYRTQGRVIIPIHDIEGRPVSWIGRTVIGAIPKYLFPPAFKGAETLYNAWAIPSRADYLIISEGVFDAYGWWRHGAKNVVATFGKKISETQESGSSSGTLPS